VTSISIIGLGTYARALGSRAVEGGSAVEVIGRDAAKTKDLAAALGVGATAGVFGTVPAGDIVILAVPYGSAVDVVRRYGDALAGKVVIDISNTFTAPDDTELVTPVGSSGAQEIAKAVPASAHVVKAFNTVFGHILALGGPLDVLFAGDNAPAKAPELSTEKITQVVRSYIELAGHESAAGHRSADEVAALFADNAIFESPTGGDVHRGNEAIRDAYHSLWDGHEQRVDLVSLNVAGGEAAVHVQVISAGQRVDVIDVMTFDGDAKISSLRTYFGPSNVVTLQ
jgi:predicted dinucleotide-binding enzyme